MSLTFGEFLFAVLLALLTAGAIALCAREIRQRREGRSHVSTPQFVMRLVCGGLLIGLLLRVIFGLFTVQPDTSSGMGFLRFWMGSLWLTTVVAGLGMIDLILVIMARRHRRRARSAAAAHPPDGDSSA
jgi:hypothetical protein